MHGSSHLNAKNIYYSIYLTECVRCASSRYIFLFHCYLFYARRLSTLYSFFLQLEKWKKKHRINKYRMMCLYMQTTQKNERERIDVCLMRHVKTLWSILIPCAQAILIHHRRQWMNIRTHKRNVSQSDNSKLSMRERKKMNSSTFRFLVQSSFFSSPYFVGAKRPNQTVKSQWVKYTYRGWDEQSSQHHHPRRHCHRNAEQQQPQCIEWKLSMGNKKQAVAKNRRKCNVTPKIHNP